jgi:hypothetical protein
MKTKQLSSLHQMPEQGFVPGIRQPRQHALPYLQLWQQHILWAPRMNCKALHNYLVIFSNLCQISTQCLNSHSAPCTSQCQSQLTENCHGMFHSLQRINLINVTRLCHQWLPLVTLQIDWLACWHIKRWWLAPVLRCAILVLRVLTLRAPLIQTTRLLFILAGVLVVFPHHHSTPTRIFLLYNPHLWPHPNSLQVEQQHPSSTAVLPLYGLGPLTRKDTHGPSPRTSFKLTSQLIVNISIGVVNWMGRSSPAYACKKLTYLLPMMS